MWLLSNTIWLSYFQWLTGLLVVENKRHSSIMSCYTNIKMDGIVGCWCIVDTLCYDKVELLFQNFAIKIIANNWPQMKTVKFFLD